MTDIIREIEDEVQQDAVKNFIQKYAALLIGVLVAVVLGVSGYLWWNNAQARQALADSERFGESLQLIQNGDIDGGLSSLDDLTGTNNGYALLARFEVAKQSLAAGDLDRAVSQYQNIAGDQDVASQYRNLATMNQAMALANAGRHDAALSALDAISNDDLSFGAIAMELRGKVQWEAGDTAGALKTFEALKAQLGSEPFQAVTRVTVVEENIDTYIEQLKLSQ